MAEPGIMASFINFRLMSFIFYKEDNNISEFGCKWLSKTSLTDINFISLSRIENIQKIIKLEDRDANN